ncbi:sodium/glutamate symporter [Methanohalophilus portucalensis]|uniref:Glutamate:Na+ symporter, ESS family n=2 Tax=Methanohalophilus portucalensis TaxID=39664 RepID=A0A1L9C559_9EURY|nr:sodium/glutamate symporter [Methanohalophilus portucalensis]ATU08300.1 sodium:glutamate symporter [Methanohalophilus portucalensis]OJH49621.1 sodium/glutamate symporter [Methanohalophilus portucalensis FDF-1]RNI13535.1 sodium:glutamate symporter [Methanohalophilus portucalensis FDF-1]SMH35092.1 glutamate:Na+ symporter, ESS family [Methanohalophilus portucalensis FDF-1]
MSASTVGLSLIVIGLILLIGKWIRVVSPPFQKLFIPSSLIGGFLGLFLGGEVLGNVVSWAGITGTFLSGGLFPEYMLDVWIALPGLFINIIFATLFLGKKIPTLRQMWILAGPQITHGQTIAWGQYVFGILVTILILTPFFGIDPMAGALIEISFEGGHGTAAGMAATFEELGFEEAGDLSLGLATIGILFGVIFGIVMLNYGVRSGKTMVLQNPEEISLDASRQTGIIDFDARESAGKITTRPESIEPLSLHFAYVGVAIGIGYVILQALIQIEKMTWGQATDIYLMTYIPLFPLAMIGGITLQMFLDRYDVHQTLDRGLMMRIQGLSLDILITSAIATLSLTVIGNNLMPFIILATVGIVWNLVAFMYLGPRMMPTYWFERSIGNFGQSMGMTASGLLLMRIADPDNRSPAMEGFGYKQLLFEPIVGGGVFTAASVPLIFYFGPVPVLVLAFVVMLFWMGLGIFYFGKK